MLFSLPSRTMSKCLGAKSALAFSWLLSVLVISAVLHRGMTAMRRQTPGHPAAALHHRDDRMEELTAPVCLLVPLVSRFMSHSKFWVLWRSKKPNIFEGVSERGRVNSSDGKHQNSVPCWECDSGSGGANGKTSSPTVCVCQFMF